MSYLFIRWRSSERCLYVPLNVIGHEDLKKTETKSFANSTLKNKLH